MTKDELQKNVDDATAALSAANLALGEFEAKAENNVFSTIEDAMSKLEDEIESEAFQDCEGAHNCGNEEYRRPFMVDGVEYVAIGKFQYNRHDKMYYYIDGSEFSYEVAK